MDSLQDISNNTFGNHCRNASRTKINDTAESKVSSNAEDAENAKRLRKSSRIDIKKYKEMI